MQYIDIHGREVEKPLEIDASWRPSVYGIYIKEEKVLMCQSKLHAFLEFPGGGIEEGESFTDALRREFMEETQLQPIGFHDQPDYVVQRNSLFINGKYYRTILLYYLIQDAELSSKPVDEEENIIAKVFVDLHNPSDNLHIAHKEAFHYFASKYRA